ncbi:hypothetical protein [Enterobacter roggenkampii]|uniref:hypothetical protein n=1 Tax=Enterobacter roggenkampii TaxID=1812935 RepID=UPI0029DAF792|nr:hypothetical protein [Enterobacter roggenkampii]MDX7478699.1 hypothetical protein [Enterobacter roggenkampii]
MNSRPMSNIDKRDGQVQRYANFGVDMMEWADGGYVKYSDYVALLDELEAAENRIADQRETLLAARSYVMQCARMGDAHANGVLQAIDRAAGKGEAS